MEYFNIKTPNIQLPRIELPSSPDITEVNNKIREKFTSIDWNFVINPFYEAK